MPPHPYQASNQEAFQFIAAPFTPFYPDGSLNFDLLESYADKLWNDGVAGVFICGTTGEGLSLTQAERKHAAEAWKAAVAGRMRLIVHVGHAAADEACDLARHAESIRADGISAIGPVFFTPSTQEALVRFNQKIAAAAPETSFYCYHFPSMSRAALPASGWFESMAAAIPTFRGIKFTHEDVPDFGRCVEIAGGRYELFFGRDELLLQSLALGASAAVGSTYNFAAPLYLRAVQAWRAGERTEAERLQSLCTRAIGCMVRHGGLPAIRATLAMAGIDCGPMRLPLSPLAPEAVRSLRAELDELAYFEAIDAARPAPRPLTDGAQPIRFAGSSAPPPLPARRRYTVSRDDAIYHAWPDLALTSSGRLVCVFSECTHHFDRSYTRIVCVSSDDRGRTWTAKRPVSLPLHKQVPTDPHWNCGRITALQDGRLVVVADRVAGTREGALYGGEQSNWLWYSRDDGETWEGPVATPVRGIVPDRVIEIPSGPHAGRWTLSAHTPGTTDATGAASDWTQQLWFSDDRGVTWDGPACVAAEPGLLLCEGSVLPLPGGELVCFLRENSFRGLDAFRTISRDGGQTWGELSAFPLPGCHRPVAGLLQSGRVLITYRFLQGGGPRGWAAQNFLAALTDAPSCLAPDRAGARARIMPLDYDRSPDADLGYSGWVQFSDGEIYVVSYIVDDAPKGQIRGYALSEEDFLLTPGTPKG